MVLKKKSKLKFLQYDCKSLYPDCEKHVNLLKEYYDSEELIGISSLVIIKDKETGELLIGHVFTKGILDHIYLSIGGLEELKIKLLNYIED